MNRYEILRRMHYSILKNSVVCNNVYAPLLRKYNVLILTNLNSLLHVFVWAFTPELF